MDRERIAHIFFFGFLAVMGYELYLLLSPFLVPIVLGDAARLNTIRRSSNWSASCAAVRPRRW